MPLDRDWFSIFVSWTVRESWFVLLRGENWFELSRLRLNYTLVLAKSLGDGVHAVLGLPEEAMIRLASIIAPWHHSTVADGYHRVVALCRPPVRGWPLAVVDEHTVLRLQMRIVVAAACRRYDPVGWVDTLAQLAQMHVVVVAQLYTVLVEWLSQVSCLLIRHCRVIVVRHGRRLMVLRHPFILFLNILIPPGT